jgi:hypothetical protein
MYNKHDRVTDRLTNKFINQLIYYCLLARRKYKSSAMYKETDYYLQLINLVLYGCETWSLTLREEHRLRVFENKVLRRIIGPKRDEVTGGWRKLHNEELRDLYSSPSIIIIMKSRRTK